MNVFIELDEDQIDKIVVSTLINTADDDHYVPEDVAEAARLLLEWFGTPGIDYDMY